jgi:hypothetical protein
MNSKRDFLEIKLVPESRISWILEMIIIPNETVLYSHIEIFEVRN